MSKIPGGPSPAGVNMMRVGARQGAVGTSKRYHWQTDPATPASRTEFPIVSVGPDPYDDVAHIKSQYANAGAGNTNWVVPFERSDAAYLMRKRDQEEKAQFDAWVSQKYDLTDPAQNMMLQTIAPELYQRREEVIDTQQALVTRYAKCRLRGAKSLDDLYLEWLVETGRIDLPKGPIWSPRTWRDQQRGQQEDVMFNRGRYMAGFFSPLKWMSETQAGQGATANNRFDIAGDGNRYENVRAPYYGVGGEIYDLRYPNPFPYADVAGQLARPAIPALAPPAPAAAQNLPQAGGDPED